EDAGVPPPERKSDAGGERADSGTVVGAMQSSDAVQSDRLLSVGGVRAMPAVRALARKLRVDLSRVTGTGAAGVVTMADVKRAAEGAAAAGHHPSPAPRAGKGAADFRQAPAAPSPTAGEGRGGSTRSAAQRTALAASGRPMRTQPPSVSASGQPEQLRGVRRN